MIMLNSIQIKPLAVAFSLLSLVSEAQAVDSVLLERILAGEHRSEAHQQRDRYRHPLETLTFFDIKPDMTVVEIWPGGKGWYTEILAPYLKDQGTFYAAQFDSNASIPYFQKSYQDFLTKTQAQPELYEKMQITVLQPPEHLSIAPPDSADRVLTFRNVHNWVKSNQVESVFAAMFKVLKPGGILGVVEHRLPADQSDPSAESGYVKEQDVIQWAENAGFKLLDRSEINANPKDTHDYPKGVWTLPPTLRLKEQDQDKYLAIGESDRMTLKFIKPNSNP
jgi:predicted methyltransferase